MSPRAVIDPMMPDDQGVRISNGSGTILTQQALMEALDDIWALVGPGDGTVLLMNATTHTRMKRMVFEAVRIRRARRHPMLRHLTRRQFDRMQTGRYV